MKVLIIVIPGSTGDLCLPVNESEALEVLECMNYLGIRARLEIDEPPFDIPVPEHFNWVAFFAIIINKKLIH